MKRKIAIGLIVIGVLFTIAVIVLASNLDKLIKAGVEKGGTMVLGVPTTLDGVTVKMGEGTVGLDGLTLGSPEGFGEPSMFALEHAHTTVDIASLRTDEMVVREVVIDGPTITLEIKGTKTNWGTVLDGLKGEGEAKPEEEEAKPESGKTLRIDRIVFANAQVRVAGTGIGGATVPLPRLEIKAKEPAEGDGQTVEETLTYVISSLYKAILGAASDVLPLEQIQALGEDAIAAAGEAVDVAAEAAGEVAGAATEAVGGAKDAGAAVSGAAADAAKDVGGKAKGLFRSVVPGKKDDQEE